MYKLIFSLLAMLLVSPGYVHAIERHALVIGNSNYHDGPSLRNPRNDATDMAELLEHMGYQIYSNGPLLDVDRTGMARAIAAFSRSLPDNAVSLFYYAGHGMAVNNDNYLIPVNHALEYKEQLPEQAINLRSIVQSMKYANPEGVNVLLLDACRDNPLQRGFRSAQAGLQRLNDIPQGSFIGYAADSGQVAGDGFGRNGIYTGELLKVMAENPNLIIELAHKLVSRNVYEKTNGNQFPVSENKVYGDWCFEHCNTNAITDNLPTMSETDDSEPLEIKTKSKMNYWKIAGGVALGLLVAGLVAQGDGDTPPATGRLPLTPPQ